MNRFDFLGEKLDLLEKQNLIRDERVFLTPQLPKSTIGSKEYLLFSSSNYLSLSENEEILDIVKTKMKNIGMGSGGSRLTTGTHKLHIELEKMLSNSIGYENSLLYSSGFMGNLGFLSAVCDKNTIVFSDEKNHASIIDGIKLSGATVQIYKHLDFLDLENKLKKHPNNRKVVVSDGVFSMDGDILPLDKFCLIAKKYDAISYVDDAHGFGVLGDRGLGITEMYDTLPDALLVTFSKAIGTSGAAILCSDLIRKYLYNSSREFIFSTSLSPFDILMTIESLNYILKNNNRQVKLMENINYLKDKLKDNGYDIRGNSHIIPIFIGDEEKAQKIFENLLKCGIFLSIIRFPSVPRNQSILRVTPMAEHSIKDLDFLVEKLNECVRSINDWYIFIVYLKKSFLLVL